MSRTAFPWSELGIDRTDDASVIRRAYAAKLKAMDPDADPAAFARLRDARGYALHLAADAAQRGADTKAGDETGDDDAADARWEDADDADDRWSDDTDGVEADGRYVIRRPDLAPPEVDADAVSAPPAEPEPEPEPDPAVERVRAAAKQLYETLLEADGAPDRRLSADEEAQAHDDLTTIIDHAGMESLTQFEMASDWTAETLARGWPRSAPLLQRAMDAFNWEAEADRIDTHPAKTFLMARLRGLRFVEAVEKPDHVLHKAWSDLQKPGPVTWWQSLNLPDRDITHLLKGIRENFPEVENYLSPERVASWEKRINSNGDTGSWVGLIMAGLFLLMVISIVVGDRSGPTIDENFREQIVAEAFGEGRTFDWLATVQPDLADIATASATSGYDGNREALRDTVRDRMNRLHSTLSGEELLASSRIHAGIAKAMADSSVAKCMAFLQSETLGNTYIPAEIRTEEQNLAAKLAEAKMLNSRIVADPPSARIPGDVIDAARRRAGVPEKRIPDLMARKGTDAEQCAWYNALLQTVLERDFKEREAVLKLL